VDLVEASRKLQLIIDTIPVLIVSYTAGGAPDFANQTLRNYVGPDVAIKDLLDAVHPEDRPELRIMWRDHLATGESFQSEHRLRRADGEYRWHAIRHVPLRDDSGELVAWYGAGYDIEDRKQAETAMRKSETQLAEAQRELQFTIDSIAALVVTHQPDGRRIFVNQRWRDYTGLTLAQATGDGGKTKVYYHPDDVDATEVAWSTSLQSGDPLQIDLRLLRTDGAYRWHTIQCVPLRDESEGIKKWYSVAFDIEDRKQAESALQRSEQRYRHLFHHVPIPLWQVNSRDLLKLIDKLRADGITDLGRYIDEHPEFLPRAMEAMVIEEANRSAVRLFGARDVSDLLGPVAPYWQAGAQVFRNILEARYRGEQEYQEETKLMTFDGRTVQGLFTSAFPAALSELGMSVNSFVDATETIKARDMLQQAQADFAHATRVSVLGELTASIAHEVNQPLAAIATSGEASLRWLARPEPNIEEVRALTKRVIADARRASEIIGRIRAMAARRAPEQNLLSLDDVIREALLFLDHEVQSRGVTILHVPASAAPKVLADRTQLQQVVVNLVVNAMQAIALAGSTKRHIIVRTIAPDPTTLRCSVDDSGPGIEPPHLARLFDSFFTTKESGMGMGLRICRSVIEAHGGRISADNESAHGGARFSFTLPAAGTTI
jgi:PAS domain S-box-containing protein